MEIPIRNIFYLLAYASERATLLDPDGFSSSDYREPVDFFAMFLIEAVLEILGAGLYREYKQRAVRLAGVRGRLLFSESIADLSFPRGESICLVDELDPDVLHNQIIKTTMKILAQSCDLSADLHDQIEAVLPHFDTVSTVTLSHRIFSTAALHGNNRLYYFPLAICRLIFNGVRLDDQTGEWQFRNVCRGKFLRWLFENFVYRFFEREQATFNVHRMAINWEVCADEKARPYLPSMKPDIVLESPARKLIIDTKFYRDALPSYRGRRRIRSAHLYQIYAYLSAAARLEGRRVEGILLYPTTTDEIDLRFVINGFSVRVQTLNLSQDWRQIHEDLLRLLS